MPLVRWRRRRRDQHVHARRGQRDIGAAIGVVVEMRLRVERTDRDDMGIGPGKSRRRAGAVIARRRHQDHLSRRRRREHGRQQRIGGAGKAHVDDLGPLRDGPVQRREHIQPDRAGAVGRLVERAGGEQLRLRRGAVDLLVAGDGAGHAETVAAGAVAAPEASKLAATEPAISGWVASIAVSISAIRTALPPAMRCASGR